MVVFAARLPDTTYRVEVLPPLRPDYSGSERERVRALTVAISASFQRIIATYPSQWYPFHAIWPDLRPIAVGRPMPHMPHS
jgi:lauroyl/myristoyl acyltransferase